MEQTDFLLPLIKILCITAGLLLSIFLVINFFAKKKYQKKTTFLRIEDRLYLNEKTCLYIVKVYEENFLVGQSGTNLTFHPLKSKE